MKLKSILTSKPLLALEIAALLFFGFNVGKEMYKKHSIEQEISRLEGEIGKLENNKSELNTLLSYVRTDAFVEQEARSKLNLASPGESLVLMPEADITQTQEGKEESESEPAPSQVIAQNTLPENQKNNLALWWQYFFEHGRLEVRD